MYPAVRAIIMGCGRVGILLTQELVTAGHQVTVIDKNAAAFQQLPPDRGDADRRIGLRP